MKAFTDYPFVELGDTPGKKAPIRWCEILAYDGDKYCLIRIGFKYLTVKSGYLYTDYGRLGDVPVIDISSVPIDPHLEKK